MKVALQNDTGLTKQVKVGFSWTTFFFSFLVPLFRGDMKWTAIMFVISMIVNILTVGIGGWVVSFLLAIVYNKIYIKDLLKKGYHPATEYDKSLLIQNDILPPEGN